MARALSQVYTVIRGSVGGITYLANQFHQIIARARTSPVNPATVWQTNIRSNFGAGASKWNVLTDAQRLGWEEYASTLVYEGPLGSYSIPGRLVYIALYALVGFNNKYGSVTGPFPLDPPEIGGFFSVGPVEPATFTTPSATGIAISLTNQTGTDGIALFHRSIGFGPSRRRYKGPWVASAIDSFAIPDGAATLFQVPGLVADAIYFSRIRCFHDASPLKQSAEFINRHVAEATGP